MPFYPGSELPHGLNIYWLFGVFITQKLNPRQRPTPMNRRIVAGVASDVRAPPFSAEVVTRTRSI